MGKNTDLNGVPIPVMNQRISEALQSDAPGSEKVAQQASTEYTRLQLREDSFTYEILPPVKATDDMLQVSLGSDIPQILWELEPESPGAKWAPLQTVPEGEYMQGSRYAIPLARVLTPLYQKDVDELRTYKMDLRKVLTGNSVKDGLEVIDGKFIETVDAIVADTENGVAGEAHNLTGKIQWRTFTGGLTRENFVAAKQMLPSGSTLAGWGNKFRLKNHCCLMNDVTAAEFEKWGREEVGGDSANRMFEDGLYRDTFFGLKTIFTIKGAFVPDGTVYFFAAPEFLGKFFYLTDWTTYLKKEMWWIETCAYFYGGFAFGNVAGVARADFVA